MWYHLVKRNFLGFCRSTAILDLDFGSAILFTGFRRSRTRHDEKEEWLRVASFG